MESILDNIKLRVNIETDDTDFDIDLIDTINGIFAKLTQFGVGEDLFEIEDSSDTWTDYQNSTGCSDITLQLVKAYTRDKAIIIFDPPSSSFVLDSLKTRAEETESRLIYQVEHDE